MIARRTGRPRKRENDKYRTPCRSLGRISWSDWAVLRAAAKVAGTTFTQWAVTHLLRVARYERKERDRRRGNANTEEKDR